ncbi:YcjF family protein [Chitinimonas lacunae]|uniref:YcjF family protein n=1 Tax=Chitinimonas lacunae TaxID=1963018 RepID=A0ABV8MNL6_9NEIS
MVLRLATWAKQLGDSGKQVKEIFRGDYSKMSPAERDAAAEKLVRDCALTAAALAPIPLPFSEMLTVTPLQFMMVRGLGHIYGYRLSPNGVRETLALVGGSMVGRQLTVAALKGMLPGLGSLVAIALDSAWTYAMGRTAIVWFRSNQTASPEELRRVHDEAVAEAEAKMPEEARSALVKARQGKKGE